MAYNYWIVVVSLVKAGIPYEAILSFSEQELYYVLGTLAAFDQREQDEAARQERLASQQNNMQQHMY